MHLSSFINPPFSDQNDSSQNLVNNIVQALESKEGFTQDSDLGLKLIQDCRELLNKGHSKEKITYKLLSECLHYTNKIANKYEHSTNCLLSKAKLLN